MRIIGVGGEPGTGKSELMKTILGQLGEGVKFKYELLRGNKYINLDPKLLILGIYEEGVLFCGTDRLSMIAIKSLKEFVRFCTDNDCFLEYTILFEGDRFFKQDLFKTLESLNINYSLYILKVSEEVLSERRASRGENNQTEKFLKGRRTMYENIERDFASNTKVFVNNKREDTSVIIEEILKDLKLA